MSGGITLFHNDLKDMISIDSRTADASLAPSYPNFVGFLPDGRPIFSYQNIASVRTKGIELGWRWDIGSDGTLGANYTYTDAKNTSGAKELLRPIGPSTPPTSISTGIRGRTGR